MSTARSHNAEYNEEQSPSAFAPREAVLTVEHAGRPEHTPDVEGVHVRVDSSSTVMTLEDGERLVFDTTELRSALRAA